MNKINVFSYKKKCIQNNTTRLITSINYFLVSLLCILYKSVMKNIKYNVKCKNDLIRILY